MVKKKKAVKKKEEESEDEGLDLDDAFSDDEDVTYAESKPRKIKKKDLDEEIEEAEEEISKISRDINGEDKNHVVKASKPITKIRKGDKIKIDGKDYEVDEHYVLIDHGTTKEMAIELFDKNDKDYQLRYFNDQMESTMELYELQEIMFIKKPFNKIEW